MIGRSGCEPNIQRSRYSWPATGLRYSVSARSAFNVLGAASLRATASAVLNAAGVPHAIMVEPTARIPLRHLVALYEAAARLTGDSVFGLRLGARANFRSFDLLGYVVANSPTLDVALASAARYLPLWTDGAALEIVRERTSVNLIWSYLDPDIGECRHDCEMTLLTIAHLLRVLVPGITLRAVHFRHAAPNDTAEHARSFRATVQFRTACNELIVDRAALARPLPNADPGLHVLLSRYADVLLPDVGQRPLIDRVRTAIQDALDAGPIRLSAIAQRVGMSGRSLERHLNTHGYSFRGVLASERCRVAEHYLAQSDLTTAQIAQRLGYAEVAQFHRAFRSWTGSTPSERRLCARPLAAAADSASNVAGNAMAIESPRDQYRRPHGAGAATMTRESKV